MRRSAPSITVVVVGALTLLGCADDGRDMAPPRDDQSESIIAPTETSAVLDTATPAPTEPMTLYGPWLDGGPIPSAHTCAEAGRGGVSSSTEGPLRKCCACPKRVFNKPPKARPP